MKKQIDVALVISDINSGLGDVPIMEKHGLSPTEYVGILERLRTVQAIRNQDAARRLSSVSRSAGGLQERRAPRCYLVLSIRAFDVNQSDLCGQVEDLTEKGFKILGINAKPGERREFTIAVEKVEDYVVPFSFQAICRWVGTDSETKAAVSGFQITEIARRDLEQLRKLIDLAAICDPH